jgi:protein required for attachment to host cells
MNNLTKRTWILVGHRAGAVVFESRGPGAPLARVAKIEHPRGRLRAGELETDRPGRAFDRRGAGRHAHSLEHGALEQVEAELVHRLIERLEHGRSELQFERLVLIAPAKLLGRLREALSPPLRELVVASLSKDLAHADAELVRKQLFDLALV